MPLAMYTEMLIFLKQLDGKDCKKEEREEEKLKKTMNHEGDTIDCFYVQFYRSVFQWNIFKPINLSRDN